MNLKRWFRITVISSINLLCLLWQGHLFVWSLEKVTHFHITLLADKGKVADMSHAFSSCTVPNENELQGSLVCCVNGFNPSLSHHSAHVTVDDNTLVVTANIGDKKYECKVPHIDVGNDVVHCKPKKDEVEVIITKPNREYDLKSKMPK